MPVYTTILKPLSFYSVTVTVPSPTSVSVSYGSQTVLNNQPVSGSYTLNYFKTGLGNQQLSVSTNPVTTGNIVFNEVLPDPSVFEDNQQKTLLFDDKSDSFITNAQIFPELFSSYGNKLVSFLNGRLYTHDATGFNNFFGQQYSTMICRLVNPAVPYVKYFENISIESNLLPDYTHLETVYTENPVDGNPAGSIVKQSTDLVTADFNWKEGVWYVPFYRDRLTPGQSSYNQALQTGDKMWGQWAYLMLLYSNLNIQLSLNAVNIGFQPSSGSKTIPTVK